ncbi:protein C19orf12 homolog [Thrips palmi]|uniref:Protein C19orf12 homolog n=1 Tax=Thrips palmi TaxID=161013 RepID=A0A6P8ZS04_THRPL|nr:protein C19orf12 homolog [Thrips palmi]
MPINTHEVMSLLGQLADQQGIKVAVQYSMLSGVAVGVCTAVGGILMGPFGLAVGGTLGSVMAAFKTSGHFKPVSRVILEDMTPIQQTQLAASCMRIIQDFRVEDVAILLPLLLNTPAAQQALLTQLTAYITNEMKLKIID